MVVDQTKELSNEFIREQLSDFSDLVVPMDLAPPTLQLMLWKESGGADKLFAQPCSTAVAPQINEVNERDEPNPTMFFVIKAIDSEITAATVKSRLTFAALFQEYLPD